MWGGLSFWFWFVFSRKFFISLIVLFNSRIFGVLFIISISLLIISIPFDIVLLVSYNSLLLASFSSLDIFKTIDLKSLSSKSNISSGRFFRKFLLICFYLWMGHTFCFLCMPCKFCWKLNVLNIIIWQPLKYYSPHSLRSLFASWCRWLLFVCLIV